MQRPASSMAALTGGAPGPEPFLETLAESFARWLGRWRSGGIGQVRAAWLAAAHPLGTALVTHGKDGETVEGLFDGLDETGALRLRLAGGSVATVRAGDVFLL
jgi:BirA family biotin operon repressor/biotin-[acetyl-CoA-carboxylase] ligase